MRKGGGKQKGASFEREVCKELSLWVSRGQRKDIFWRSAMSGGRSTVALKGGDKLTAQAGDVSAIDPMGQEFIETFLVECKAYKDLNLKGLFKRLGHLHDFWIKLCEDCETYDKLPFLVARENNFPTLVLTTRKGLVKLGIFRTEAVFPQISCHIIFWKDFLLKRPVKKRIRL